MGQIEVTDKVSGRVLVAKIKGEKPTKEEKAALDRAIVRLRNAPDPDADVDPDAWNEPQVAPRRPGWLPQNVNDVRPLFIGAGAGLGTVAGMPAGPVGAYAGSALGAAGGSVTADAAIELGRKTGLVGPGKMLEDDPRLGAAGGPLGPTTRALNQGALDLGAPLGLGAVARTGRAAFRGIAGVGGNIGQKIASGVKDDWFTKGVKAITEHVPVLKSLAKRNPDQMAANAERFIRAQRMAQYADELGVPLGLENVTESGWIRGFRGIFGKIPFFSRPFKSADVAQGKRLVGLQDDLISDLAPYVRTVTDTGADMSRNALRRTASMSKWFSRRYNAWFAKAESAGVRVPTTHIRQRARDLVDEFSAKLPPKTVKGKQVPIRPPESEASNDVIAWARSELANLSDDMSAAQYKRLARSLNLLMARSGEDKAAAGLAATLRYGLERDLEAVVGAPAIVAEIKALNGEFGSWAELLKRPTAQRIARAEPHILGKINFGKQTKNESQLFKSAFDTNAPDALADLQKLIGPRSFRAATRRHVEDVFMETMDPARAASKEGVINISAAKKALGIGREGAARRSAFVAMLRLSGSKSSIKDWEKFFDVADAALGQKSVDVAQFLARRVVLSGVRRGLSVLNPMYTMGGAGVAGGAAAGGFSAGLLAGQGPLGGALALMSAFYFRKGTEKFFVDPRALRLATRAIDSTLAPGVRKQASIRLARLIGQDQIREISDSLTRFAQRSAGSPEQTMPGTLAPLQNVNPR